jgi:hypothetical protein
MSANWVALDRMPAVIGTGWEDLWDIHFVDADHGWLVGLHAIWYSDDGGQSWNPTTLLDSQAQPITGNALEEVELYAIDVVGGVPGPMLGLASAEPGWISRATDPLMWQVVFEVEDLCPTPPAACSTTFSANQLTECGCDKICTAGLAFEPWDIEISRHPTEKLAICAGGIGPDCGLILASLDDGLTWALEPHECGNGTVCGSLYGPPGVGGAVASQGVPRDLWRLDRLRLDDLDRDLGRLRVWRAAPRARSDHAEVDGPFRVRQLVQPCPTGLDATSYAADVRDRARRKPFDGDARSDHRRRRLRAVHRERGPELGDRRGRRAVADPGRAFRGRAQRLDGGPVLSDREDDRWWNELVG